MFDHPHYEQYRSPPDPEIAPLYDLSGGVDVLVEWHGDLDELAAEIQHAAVSTVFRLSTICNGGIQVWPDGSAGSDPLPYWRCHLVPVHGSGDSANCVPELMAEIGQRLRWTRVEKTDRWKELQAVTQA